MVPQKEPNIGATKQRQILRLLYTHRSGLNFAHVLVTWSSHSTAEQSLDAIKTWHRIDPNFSSLPTPLVSLKPGTFHQRIHAFGMPFKSSFPFIQYLLSSTPFNNFIETEDYDIQEALRSIVPDPIPIILQRTLSYQSHPRPYLSYELFQLYRQPHTIPLQFLTQPFPIVHNCTFTHPEWPLHEWNKIWESKPLMLKPTNIPLPTVEDTFPGALLRIHLTQEHLSATVPLIMQGTTIAFKGDDRTYARYVVEWCERIEDHIAYLKVVSMGKFQNPHPYNDPLNPAFILVIPSRFLSVSFPPSSLPPIWTHQSHVFFAKRRWTLVTQTEIVYTARVAFTLFTGRHFPSITISSTYVVDLVHRW